MYLGLDFGTSGARACAIVEAETILYENRYTYPNATAQTPLDWREALHFLLKNLPSAIATQIRGMAISATSATVLLCDVNLEPTSPALLYFDRRAQAAAEQLKKIAPPDHIVCGATSGLAKFLWLTAHANLSNTAHFLHQADWLAAFLTGTGGVSDYHNALKTGYDIERLCWPDWVLNLPHADLLPRVVAPGAALAPINTRVAQHFKLNPACVVHAGTTDSIAAFIAAGANELGANKPGAAVTSLGTTLVLKILSKRRIEAAQYGVYSHRYGDLWLAGGASNAGGSVLRQHFSDDDLAVLSQQIDPNVDTTLDYYPLPRPGERFPVNDSALMPRLTPRPLDDAQFLHGILQGLSCIEVAGYAKLVELGATPLTSVLSMGGGAKNQAWIKMRERLLGVPVTFSSQTEAALGAALLAKRQKIA